MVSQETIVKIMEAIVSLQDRSSASDKALLGLCETLTQYTLELSKRVKHLEDELLILQSVVMSSSSKKEDK